MASGAGAGAPTRPRAPSGAGSHSASPHPSAAASPVPAVHAAAAGGAGAGAGGHTSKFFDLEFRPSARVGSLYHVECTAARNLARSCIKVKHHTALSHA
jgi:hypothetical protein